MSLYQVWCDEHLLFDPRLDGYKLPSIKLSQELNKADSLKFSIYPQHSAFSILTKFKPTIRLERDGEIISKLRILDTEVGWENGKVITAEGPLAWLNDSIQRPFEFPQDSTTGTSPADYFNFLLTRHNAQVPPERQFVIGEVTVTDPNNYISRSDTQYSTTWTLLKEGLLDTLGGYIVPRYEGDSIYLDYLADFDILANQPLEFGLNMLSIETSQKGEDIATAIIPLGVRDEETNVRLTISALPDSTTDDICKVGDMVFSKTAEELYGARITAVETWDDVTLASNLLTKATALLAQKRQMPSTVTLTAADLSGAGYEYNAFSLGTYVDVHDEWHEEAHGLQARYLVKKISTDILNPANNKLVLGATTFGLSDKNRQAVSDARKIIEANIIKERTDLIREIETRYTSAIEQSERDITLTVSENYYTKEATDGLIGTVSTQITQTADEININFSELQTEVGGNKADADAKFQSLESYIRLAGGKVTLGEVGSQITLVAENDRIGIYVNGVAVTYWTADDFQAPMQLTIPVGGRLNLGSYAYIPRDNGSLDFMWIGG